MTQAEHLEVAFFHSDEQDVYQALQAAMDNFAAQHIGLPEIVVMELWRRVAEVRPDDWYAISHGPVKVQLRSPHDCEYEEIAGSVLSEHNFICARRIATPEKEESNASA